MPYSYPISVVVGSAGATIEAEDGLKLVIAPSALSRDTTITIAEGVTAPDVSGLTEVSRAYEIGPVGTRFDRTCTLFIPYFSAYESQRSSIRVYMGDTVDSTDPNGWLPAPVDSSESGLMGGEIDAIQCAMAAIPD